MKRTLFKRECMKEHSQNVFLLIKSVSFFFFFFASFRTSCRHSTWQRVENSAVLSFIRVFGLQRAQQNPRWLAFCHLQVQTKQTGVTKKKYYTYFHVGRCAWSCLVTCMTRLLPDRLCVKEGSLSFSSRTVMKAVPVALREGEPPSWTSTASW